MWYGRVRSTYSAVVARRNENAQAEAAWAAFRQAHIGLTRNQLIMELGTLDAIESDGVDGVRELGWHNLYSDRRAGHR